MMHTEGMEQTEDTKDTSTLLHTTGNSVHNGTGLSGMLRKIVTIAQIVMRKKVL